ncbi:MAG: SIMPL domain-containing protein [Burkholderiaceae bacterium]|nr:SIMPL domain-containing protein [Burkholderiaceae bacterium]
MPGSALRPAWRRRALQAALAIAAALTAAAPLAAFAQEESARPRHRAERAPQLSVSATAYRDVVQDRITVTLYAERESPQPAGGQTQVSELLGPVIARLKARDGLEVRTSSYRTDPVWQQSRIVGWRTRGSIQVSAPPSEDFNRLIGELAATLNVESVGAWLSREARLAVERELIAEAVAAFRAKADTASRALGFADYTVRDVSVGTPGPVPPEPMPRAMMSRAAAADAARVARAAADGKTTVTVTVSGRVALRP